jgi:DNA-binding beta-propeller fold protein YncE
MRPSARTVVVVASALAFALAASAWVPAATVSHPLPLREVARVPLSGASVRFDYTSLDATANKLYIAHMNASQLLILDVRTRRIIKTIAAPGVHGVLAVPELNRVYASATDAHEAITLDGRTGKILARAPAGQYPDGLAYDPVERHVFVSDESGGVEAVLNAAGHRIATIIDPRTNRIVRRVALPGCTHDHGLLVDASRRLAFVACDGNARLLTLDLRTMKVTGSASVGGSPDVLAFDSTLRRLYVAAESGEVAVFAERAHSLVKLGQAPLAPFAHTVAVDPRTHLVYFPLESGSNGKPQLLIMAPR